MQLVAVSLNTFPLLVQENILNKKCC